MAGRTKAAVYGLKMEVSVTFTKSKMKDLFAYHQCMFCLCTAHMEYNDNRRIPKARDHAIYVTYPVFRKSNTSPP